MDVKGSLEKAKDWLETIKQLPYEGGPSTTKWVYLRVSEVIAVILILMALSMCFCLIYGCVVGRHMDAGVVGAFGGCLTALATAFFAFVANTKNNAQQLNAQAESGNVPTKSSTTPLSSETESKVEPKQESVK